MTITQRTAVTEIKEEVAHSKAAEGILLVVEEEAIEDTVAMTAETTVVTEAEAIEGIVAMTAETIQTIKRGEMIPTKEMNKATEEVNNATLTKSGVLGKNRVDGKVAQKRNGTRNLEEGLEGTMEMVMAPKNNLLNMSHPNLQHITERNEPISNQEEILVIQMAEGNHLTAAVKRCHRN